MDLKPLEKLFKERGIIKDRIKSGEYLLADTNGDISITVCGNKHVVCSHDDMDSDKKIMTDVATSIIEHNKDKLQYINMGIENMIRELNTKDTKIISGFPGVGKTESFKKCKDKIVIDSDSSLFSWVSKGVRNPNFPNNYIDHIKHYIGKVDIIFISSHEILRESLIKENIPYILVYPDKSLKDVYIKRYTDRGSDKKFINNIINDWDDFIDSCENDNFAQSIKVIDPSFYMSDFINTLDK